MPLLSPKQARMDFCASADALRDPLAWQDCTIALLAGRVAGERSFQLALLLLHLAQRVPCMAVAGIQVQKLLCQFSRFL